MDEMAVNLECMHRVPVLWFALVLFVSIALNARRGRQWL